MKKVLITGANGGMGSSACKLLKENGYTVYGLDITEPTDFVGEKFFKVNLSNSEEITAVKNQLESDGVELYAILHFAGIYNLDSLVEISEENFIKIFNANLFSVYRVNKIFMPLLKKGSKIIITTSELAPLDPLPFTGLYAVTKTALEKYAYSLRMELNLLNISVSIIRPGAVNTGLLKVSTTAIDRFIDSTNYYKCNAERFKKVVNSVENKNISPDKIAKLALKALNKKKPKLVYNINRNFLLRLLSVLPDRLQLFIIAKILK